MPSSVRSRKLAKFAFLYVLTAPQQSMLGAFRTSVAGLAAELGVDGEAFQRAFAELCEAGMLLFDPVANLLVVNSFLRYNPPANANVVKAWRPLFDGLPQCELRERLFEKMQAAITAMKTTGKRPIPETVSGTISETVSETVDQTVSPTIPETVPPTLAEDAGEPVPEPYADSVNSEQGAGKQLLHEQEQQQKPTPGKKRRKPCHNTSKANGRDPDPSKERRDLLRRQVDELKQRAAMANTKSQPDGVTGHAFAAQEHVNGGLQ